MSKPGDKSEKKRLPSIPAPELPYEPQDPISYDPAIGLVGCGAISVEHLAAYKKAGYRVVALCDLDQKRAGERQKDFFPEATLYSDYGDLLAAGEIEVVDVTTHPKQRVPIIEKAILAGKHVLSQKPFVLDLDEGARLADLADQQGVKLAVNQNGRWAPHFSYIRQAASMGLLGEISGAHFSVQWDHSWVKGTEFENVRHLMLYDFAIHWFDMLSCLMGDRQPINVFASATRSATQTVRPALMGQAVVQYEGAQASLVFNGDVSRGPSDTTFVTGSQATISSCGTDFKNQRVTLITDEGRAEPTLVGTWFPDGFHGTMGELLSAIEEDREPSHSARNNLRSLSLCFAAVASADTGEPVTPGTIRKLPE